MNDFNQVFNMKIIFITLLAFLASFSFLFSQPKIEWAKCYGGSSDDYASSIQQTSDGGYIIAGTSSSNDGDVSGNHGGEDFWIVKLSPDTIISSVNDNPKYSQTDFSIQPNPVSDNLSIKINSESEENYFLDIYNIQGDKIESVLASQNINIQINTNDYSNGMYYVVMKTQSNTTAKPFVVIKQEKFEHY